MPVDYLKARRVLARRDPVIRDLMRRYGACGLPDVQHADPFAALVHAILSQQLSLKAAATITRRFHELFGGRPPNASQLSAVSDGDLRAVGISGQKSRYLRDLSRRVLDGSLPLAGLEAMDDHTIVDALTQVTGIGRWTAEMFLIFRLSRPDVLPVGDLGIVKAVQRAYRLRKAPTPDRLTRIGEAWRPYRSIACWYLWASLDNRPLED